MIIDYRYITLEECYEYNEHYFDIECNGDKNEVKITKKGGDDLLTKSL